MVGTAPDAQNARWKPRQEDTPAPGPFSMRTERDLSKPAARLGDTNACPLPGHGSNPTVSGSPDVLINGLPALRVGDSSACGDAVAEGIGCILVNGQPIAFLGSATAHGGVIVSGSGDVLVGTQHTPHRSWRRRQCRVGSIASCGCLPPMGSHILTCHTAPYSRMVRSARV